MSLEDAAEWHGWSHENRALFISPLNDEQIGLFLQLDRDTQLVAVFVDPAVAMIVMDFMDGSLKATGEANSVLLARLMSEQPLAFAQAASQSVPDDTQELFGGD